MATPTASPAVVRTVPELRQALTARRSAGRRIGFVPTMGALHEGHASLVDAARSENDVVVASVFVNPMQFGPHEDLAAYPRTLDADRALLAEHGCDLLFAPLPDAIYPRGFRTRVTMEGLTDVLCGASRPGHFDGVLTVVLKLLNMVQPHRAYFGAKDYQQVLVIRTMARDLDLDVAVRTCPIVREADGLAMSSRNRYLGPEERAQAVGLRAAVLAMDAAFRHGERSVAALLETGAREIAARPLLRPDYLEIRDAEDLSPRTVEASEGDLVALAVHAGEARLIDNGRLGRENAAS